ncbi:MAG TPA: hypothetical protein VHR66_17870, partial [Gemmataceae bacterium]|nr:hypothetical protein [Gemmataceae bacterium]
TSDGLSLNGYWFQGNAIDKQRPDAVMMFPAPGNKVNDAWIGLARALSEKNFSVLLFDWRGCGLNAADTAGSRIFEDKTKFWTELYNRQLLKPSQKLLEDKGLDYKTISAKSDTLYRYRDFMLNDLLAARYYLDRQNDNGKCNTNRVWIVTEKDGGQLGLAFIVSEFSRNTIYNPKKASATEETQFKAAGKDYCGLTTLSYASNNATASAVFKNGMNLLNLLPQKECKDHLEHRLAMVMVYGKKEGAASSKSAVAQAGAGGSDEEMRKNFKYMREMDNSKQAKAISGIDLIDPMDSFGTKADIVKAMVEISRDKQNFGKDATDREANKMTFTPRFEAEKFGRR